MTNTCGERWLTTHLLIPCQKVHDIIGEEKVNSMAPSTIRSDFSKLVGRAVKTNPPNRFEKTHLVPEPEENGSTSSKTRTLRDRSRSIIASNHSPDVGFDFSINPYRGCEHGCVYCYARPTHEYLGFSSGLDFESRIMIKEDAAALLRSRLLSQKWKPQVLALSGVTDPYQPLERKLRITRSVLEVLTELLNPVMIVTKNYLVTRDIDLLSRLAKTESVAVSISITTLDNGIQRCMEPRTSSPLRRLAAIEALSEAGIPVSVNIAPVIPALTDHEIPSIVQAAAEAGASHARYMFLRLPHSVRQLFEEWLEMHFPERKKCVIGRIRDLRSGQLNDYRFHSRMKGQGEYAGQIQGLFENSCRKSGISRGEFHLSSAAFRRPDQYQMTLFET